MNPSTEELKHILSRAVPVDMLKDPDFKEILKEKAKNTAPSDESSAVSISEPPPPPRRKHNKRSSRPTLEDIQHKLHQAASHPAHLVNPNDRDMVPQLEQRSRAIQQKYEIDPNPPPPRSFKEMIPSWLDWKIGLALFFVLLILLFLVKRHKMISKLGLSYAVAAEFPFLGGIASTFSGVPLAQMKMQIARFNAPPFVPPNAAPQQTQQQQPQITAPPPVQENEKPKQTENATIQPKQKADQRKENIRMLVDEAVCYAMEARGEIDFGQNQEEEEADEDDNTEEEEEEEDDEDEYVEEQPKAKPKKKQPPMPKRKAVVKRGVGVQTSTLPPAENNYVPKPPPIPILSTTKKDQEAMPGVKRSETVEEKPPQPKDKIPGVKRTTKEDVVVTPKAKTKIIIDDE